MLFVLLSLPLPKAACSVLAPEAPLRSWADHTVLPSSASWQAIAPALRRHLRQPNFPLWAWVRNKKTRGTGSKWIGAGRPCQEQGGLVPGLLAIVLATRARATQSSVWGAVQAGEGELDEGETGFKERKMRGEKKRKKEGGETVKKEVKKKREEHEEKGRKKRTTTGEGERKGRCFLWVPLRAAVETERGAGLTLSTRGSHH